MAWRICPGLLCKQCIPVRISLRKSTSQSFGSNGKRCTDHTSTIFCWDQYLTEYCLSYVSSSDCFMILYLPEQGSEAVQMWVKLFTTLRRFGGDSPKDAVPLDGLSLSLSISIEIGKRLELMPVISSLTLLFFLLILCDGEKAAIAR